MSNSALIDSLRTKNASTANGALTNSTSLSSVLDLFFLAGACRTIDEASIQNSIVKAWAEDALKTLKVIFWAGDIREGAGERRFFKVAVKWLESNHAKVLVKNINAGNIQFFNRWDTLFELVTDISVKRAVLKQVKNGLKKGDGLLAKWLPRKKQYNDFGALVREDLGLSPKAYRQKIVKLSETVEQKMADKDWANINYEHVPSVASNKYRKAFYRNDLERFSAFIAAANKGEVKIHAGAIFPYDIYRAIKRGDNDNAVDAQWKNLPNYLEKSGKKMLPVCDVSGSMSGLPMEISVSLGLYLSERNVGPFKDAFITFSGTPQLQYLNGTLTQRSRQLEQGDWGQNTNLEAVFDLVLNKAVQNKLAQSDLPDTILIISDMEFDTATGEKRYDYATGRYVSKKVTNFDSIRSKFKSAGFEMPSLVFWNVNGRPGNSPVTVNDRDVALVSGSSPAVVKGVLEGSNSITPIDVLNNVIEAERYSVVIL